MVVVNDHSKESKAIVAYYTAKRAIPATQICHISTPGDLESIERADYEQEILSRIKKCLAREDLLERIHYIVLTLGIPLRIEGTDGLKGTMASVDSELAPLYGDLKSKKPHPIDAVVANPFYGKRDDPFSHPQFPMYLVTRLAAYDVDSVKSMIDRCQVAKNEGKFVFDLKSPADDAGDNWLRTAAILIPKDRVILDETTAPVWGQNNVIGYASWGSNDPNHDRRFPGFHWLPGAIVTEYVSTDARTFLKPPANWKTSREFQNPAAWFIRSPQSLSADYLLEGASGASGHVYEPYLHLNPRPDLIFPAYYKGRNLADSYYMGIPSLSWQNIVIGDPLCTLGPPTK